MRSFVPKPAWSDAVLNPNPFAPESKIKKKIKIKRGTRCKHPSAVSPQLTPCGSNPMLTTVERNLI